MYEGIIRSGGSGGSAARQRQQQQSTPYLISSGGDVRRQQQSQFDDSYSWRGIGSEHNNFGAVGAPTYGDVPNEQFVPQQGYVQRGNQMMMPSQMSQIQTNQRSGGDLLGRLSTQQTLLTPGPEGFHNMQRQSQNVQSGDPENDASRFARFVGSTTSHMQNVNEREIGQPYGFDDYSSPYNQSQPLQQQQMYRGADFQNQRLQQRLTNVDQIGGHATGRNSGGGQSLQHLQQYAGVGTNNRKLLENVIGESNGSSGVFFNNSNINVSTSSMGVGGNEYAASVDPSELERKMAQQQLQMLSATNGGDNAMNSGDVWIQGQSQQQYSSMNSSFSFGGNADAQMGNGGRSRKTFFPLQNANPFGQTVEGGFATPQPPHQQHPQMAPVALNSVFQHQRKRPSSGISKALNSLLTPIASKRSPTFRHSSTPVNNPLSAGLIKAAIQQQKNQKMFARSPPVHDHNLKKTASKPKQGVSEDSVVAEKLKKGLVELAQAKKKADEQSQLQMGAKQKATKQPAPIIKAATNPQPTVTSKEKIVEVVDLLDDDDDDAHEGVSDVDLVRQLTGYDPVQLVRQIDRLFNMQLEKLRSLDQLKKARSLAQIGSEVRQAMELFFVVDDDDRAGESEFVESGINYGGKAVDQALEKIRLVMDTLSDEFNVLPEIKLRAYLSVQSSVVALCMSVYQLAKDEKERKSLNRGKLDLFEELEKIDELEKQNQVEEIKDDVATVVDHIISEVVSEKIKLLN